jgi:hypothetical protein
MKTKICTNINCEADENYKADKCCMCNGLLQEATVLECKYCKIIKATNEIYAKCRVCDKQMTEYKEE